jgi:hypothetical protein
MGAVRPGLTLFFACLAAWSYSLPAWGINLPYAGMNAAPYTYFATALPFVDVAHMGGRWISATADGATTAREVNVNGDGYPASLVPDEIARTLVFTHNGGVYPTGDYTITWAGSGDVSLTGHNISVKYSAPGIIVYNVPETNSNGLALDITRTDPANPVRGLVMRAPMDAQLGAVTNPQYIKNLSHYGVMRLMDWNQTNNHKISKWADRTTRTDFHWASGAGVPYEQQVAFCNEAKKDLWLTVPHLADDDYVRNLAQLVQQRLSPNLRVWVEYSNEVWNGSFAQFHYAANVLAPQYGLPNAAQAYGRRSAEVFDIFSSEISKPERLIRVISGQTVNKWVLEQSLIGATVNGTLKADVAAIAPYFFTNMDELYEDFQQDTVDLNEVFGGIRSNIDALTNSVILNREVANNRGLPLVAYEGGAALLARPGEQHNNADFVEFLNSLNRDPRMGEMYTKLLDQWYAAGGKTFTFFNDIGPWSKWGAWGLQEDYLDLDSVKFRAVQDYLKRFQGSAIGSGRDVYSMWRSTFGSTTLLDADVNLDGAVDAADYIFVRRVLDRIERNSDYSTWRSTFGSTTMLDADVNWDGAVDAADYVILRTLLDRLVQNTDFSIWRSTFGSTTELDADVNWDGAVDTADYVVLRRYFDLHAQNGAGFDSLSAPEPSGLLLLLAGAVAVPWERGRRMQQ